MRVMQATELLKLPADTVLEAVSGTVVQAWERRTGTSQYGPWSIQNIVLADGANKITVKLSGHQELGKDWVGHRLYIVAGQGKKGGPIGLKTELNTYKGETKLQVAVNENAQLTGEDPTATKGPAPEPPTQQLATTEQRRWPSQDPDQPGEEQAPPPQADSSPAPAPAQNPVHTRNASTMRDVRKAWSKVDSGLLKLMRLRLRTLATALAVKRKADESGYPISADHVEKIDSWLAIECCRNGLLADVPDIDPPMPKADYGAACSDGLPAGLE